MLRTWRLWWNTLVLSIQINPPKFVEIVMLLLAIALLAVWMFSPRWQYLTLALSYGIGSSVSLLVREAIAPSEQALASQVIAVVLLILSIYGFTDLIRFL